MNATATIAPAPQHLRALNRANEVRLARAELKRRVATGEICAGEIILNVTRNVEVHDIIPGFPWYLTGLLSWALLVCGVFYWLSFRFVLPRFGARKGKEFAVEREPVFRTENGERVQWHEIILHSWVVKGEPKGRTGYVLDDF